MQPRAYREGKAVGDLKESVFKAYIVQIRRLRGNLGLLLLQSTRPRLKNFNPGITKR